jgi:hypothetical protein
MDKTLYNDLINKNKIYNIFYFKWLIIPNISNNDLKEFKYYNYNSNKYLVEKRIVKSLHPHNIIKKDKLTKNNINKKNLSNKILHFTYRSLNDIIIKSISTSNGHGVVKTNTLEDIEKIKEGNLISKRTVLAIYQKIKSNRSNKKLDITESFVKIDKDLEKKVLLLNASEDQIDIMKKKIKLSKNIMKMSDTLSKTIKNKNEINNIIISKNLFSKLNNILNNF